MTGQGRPSTHGEASLGAEASPGERMRPEMTRSGLRRAQLRGAPDLESIRRPWSARLGRAARPRLRRAVGSLVPALALLVLMVLHPSRGGTDDRTVLVLASLATACVVTVAGVAAYLAWRFDDRAGLAWASTGLLALGLYGGVGGVVALTQLGQSGLPPTTIVDVLVVALAAGCVLAADSVRFPERDPLLVGVALAVAGCLLRALVPMLVASSPAGVGATLLGLAALALALLGAAALLSSRLPAGWRRPLALIFSVGAAVGVIAGGSLGSLTPVVSGWLAAGGLAIVAAAALACLRQLRELDRSHQRSLRSLALRASRAESARELHQDRMHELRATAAGVASASEVLAQEHADIPPARLAALHELLVDESDRLRRLTESFERGTLERVRLDDVVGRVVRKQRALGQVVRWQSSGLLVETDSHMLREVVDILLVNAQMHAPGAWVRMSARTRGGQVVVRVRDSGPGVAEGIAGQLFERGARGEDSQGSGVGLHLARRLAEEMGGALHHEPTQTGTCFVLTLVPYAEEVDHVAAAAGEHPGTRGAG